MKNLIAVIFLSIPLGLYAQGTRESRLVEIERYKIAYLTEKLDLSPSDAKIFWPIYNQWQNEQELLRKERTQRMISFRKIDEIEQLNDNEVQALILNDFTMRQKELNLDKKYYFKLKSNLPIKTVGKFYRAQEAFKREILSRYRTSRPGRN
ncbi:hypothetical protein [Pedobacter deserti]|uniref:hypothetical protein n=1 Tax=Pedobacter deserti TaxID=2817382 RepID=UPI00210B980E|nr:hypothetical protein [Pedobacter sp. SYSU D00382]